MEQGLRIISYGGGVQSTALVVMAANRDPRLEAVMGGPVDAAVMSNVGDDSEHPAALAWVRDIVIPWAAERGFPVHEVERVRRDGTPETLLGRLTKEGSRSLPIPVRMANGAPGTRSCTADFKIRVISKWLKAHGASADNPATVAMGISTDEVQRIGNRRHVNPWENPVYPLVDMGMDRSACQQINVDTFGAPAPKSSCWFCPFHRPQMWAEMRRDEPVLFQQSVDLENLLNRRRDELDCKGVGEPPREAYRRIVHEHRDLEDDYDYEVDEWVPTGEPVPDGPGTCHGCGLAEDAGGKRVAVLDGKVQPHGKDHVFFTYYGKPLADAIPEAQTPLFTDDTWSDPGEAGCDSGHCFT